MSGRVTAIDGVAADPDVIYVGAASGGIWKTTDGGIVWKPVFDDQKISSIGALAVFQANPSIVWAGTGEGNLRNSVSWGDGVYRSLDAGKSWKKVGLEKSERIHRIVLHPADPDVAWVAALGPLWSDGGERGLFKTVDGGRTWRAVLAVDGGTGAADVAIDPANPNHLLASTWQFRRRPWIFESGGPGSGLWSSWDGGETWKRLEKEDGLPEGDLGRIGVAFAPSRPEVVYAMVEAKKSALLRSEDGGRTFNTVNAERRVNPRPFYFGEIRVDPRDANRVYSLDYTVRVSTDGGKTLKTLVRWDEIHGDHHAMWIDPTNPERFFVGNDGGVAVTADGGRNNRFVTNLPLAQFYHVAVDDEVPYNVYGGLQDNGSWRGPSTSRMQGGIRNHFWRSVGGGDGFETLPDPEDARRGYAMWQGGNLSRWNLATGEFKDIKPPSPAGVRLRFNWNAGLAVDPFDAGTIYLGSQFLHRSTDRGETWETISPDLTTNDPDKQKQAESGGLTPDVTNAENHTTIVTIEPSRAARGLIWVGSDDGRIHLTRDGGATWTSVEKGIPGVPAGTWVPAIQASPHAPATAFAVFDNHRRGDFAPYVARTDDFGATWKSLATKELAGSALSVVQDPVDPNLLFVGTEVGLWVSFDGGRAWGRWTHGVPAVPVTDLAIQRRESDLVVATHGRAIYVIDDIRPLRGLTAEKLGQPLDLLPIAPARKHWQPAEDGGFGFGATEFRGESRPYGALIAFVTEADDLPVADEEAERARKIAARQQKTRLVEREGAPEKPDPGIEARGERARKRATIEIRDAAGALVRTLRVEPQRGLNRVAWNLGRNPHRSWPRAEPPEKPDPNPSGPEVAPGRYEVTVRFRDRSATQPLEVTLDPGVSVSAESWLARERAIAEVGRIQAGAVDAVERIRAIYRDLDGLAADVAARHREELERGDLSAAELPLAADSRALREKLEAIEKKLWSPPDTVGIVFDDEVVRTRLEFVSGYLASTWDAPGPNYLEPLRAAGESYAAALAELDALLGRELPALRAEVEKAGLGLLAGAPAAPDAP
jgi:photosystem II stability/assembly factor-like uncharacterized protein